MNARRQDAWTDEEDRELAKIVLQYIQQGNTQIEAFNEAGRVLSRTPAACGFRWNANVRKEYIDDLERARKRKKERITIGEKAPIDNKISIETAINLLEKLKQSPNSTDTIYEQKEKIAQLTSENKRLLNELHRYQEVMGEIKNLWNWIEQERGM